MKYLTPYQKTFLAIAALGQKPGPVLSRVQDRERQTLRRNGLAEFNRKNWRWEITDAGREALKEHSQ